MTVPTITAARLTGAAHRAELPLLVLGPSLGSSASTLWTRCAMSGLTEVFDVVAWDLPGHGYNHAVPDGSFTVAELAEGVLRVLDDVLEQRGEVGGGRGGSFAYAGDSVGGAVGLQLLLDHPDRVTSAVLLCTGARIGEPAMWEGRLGQVSVSGTSVMVAGSAERWFAPGFLDEHPETGSALLHALADADDRGYAQVCEALAGFDVRHRLGEVAAPVLAVAGAHDVATPPANLQEIADGVQQGRYVELPDVAHLAPAEAPETVARLVRAHVLGEEPEPPAEAPAPAAATAAGERYDAGMAVRREVLGDAHVDRATAAATPLTEDFQRFITEYAWGGIWTRPGLDRRSRSMITLTALIARGHHEELAMHVRAARTNGLDDEEIKEVILQSAIYCGVPDANTAFRIAQQVLSELDATPPGGDR
ncbi:4-carboxymuconolactone decarboxylase /3-oxoadipate enol-lactonase [Nocardioides scoriae]|uniref:4-carboxymuconolactone decarboxylase /3-oxoadipate enol-lactonase n=1 Tax=Nocardioides scoriae TaxID=642780 RepID=A0A1H1NWU2_9ACTN|nr:4-carboxymuconolactone decarboxylase [Nocardioides scoriae]SDS03265.1 4-carboxymuconolactone decarboxylase /3-oxoadipate enol-lactonase [Nocardioides scoriae]